MRSFRCPSELAFAVVVALATLAACTEFESIDRDECGNGILEFGEDCDSASERCVSCSVTCDRAAGIACDSYGAGMEGFVCGADNFCHAPSGAFLPPIDRSMPVEALAVTDIDKDGIGDLLVQSSTTVDVLYGNTDGAPSARVTLQSPVARGPACFGDLDGDTALDLALPTSDGIVAYTSTFRAPAPLPFATPIDPNMGDPQFVKNLDDDMLVAVAIRGEEVRLTVLDVHSEPPTLLLDTDLCGAGISDITARQIEVAQTPTGFVLAARLDGMPPRMCAIRVERGAPVWSATVISPSIVPVSRPLLYSLTGGCPSLFVTDQDHLVEFAPTAPPCAFGPRRTFFETNAGSIPLAAFPFERTALPTAVGLVLLGGIFHIEAGQLVRISAHDRFVTNAAATDVDNDGLTDVVASSIGSADLDIYYRLPSDGTTTAFRRFRYATDGPITSFVFGDYDGNQRADIAYVQAVSDANGVNSDQLAIAYGTSDLFLPGAVVGSFGTVRAMLPTDLGDSGDPQGGIVDDLVVLYSGADTGGVVGGAINLTMLHGSPQRTMLSFFSPRAEDFGRFRGSVVGHFLDTFVRDLLAIEEVANVAGNGNLVRMWQTSALIFGGERLPYTFAPQLGDCETNKSAEFCVDQARYVAWPDLPDQLDVVIGIDRLGRAISIDPRQLNFDPNNEGASMTAQLWPSTLLGEGEANVRSLHPIDVDGERQLLISRSFGSGLGQVLLCRVDPIGMGQECLDLATAIVEASGIPEISCDDVAPARVAPTSRFAPPPEGTQLVVLCHSTEAMDPDPSVPVGAGLHGLFRVTVQNGAVAAEPLLFLNGGEQVKSGDINGDGIDDLVVVDRSAGIPRVQMFVQCTSRDFGCTGVSGPGIIVDEPAGMR